MASHSISAATILEPILPHPASQVLQIVVLADDLTGACDSAAAFLRSGHTVRVWLTDDHHQSAPETVWVRHTASRDLTPSAAAQAVAQAAQSLPHSSGTLLFKKIDSAGRGNIAAELLSAREAFSADIILLAPSFPAVSRTVSNGILHVTDVAGQDTTVPLISLFPDRDRHHVAQASSPADLVRAFTAGKEIILCDATTDADLTAIARAASMLPARILWAGSAGLANALASLHPAQNPTPPHPNPLQPQKIFVCIGTSHNVTQMQVTHLLKTPKTIQLPADEKQLSHEINGVLQITCKESDAGDVSHAWQQLSPQALVVTGGDTAEFVLRVLKADAIVLKGEVAAGIPWGIVEGGLADRLPIITKSGGFGDEACLTNAVAFLRGQS